MTGSRIPLIIPIENQVRELDSKILLACVAARRGFPSVIGHRTDIDSRITSFPRSVYVSKSMTARSIRMFRILRKLGHEIVVWDEEALVHYPPATFFSRRLSATAIRCVSHLFAWGPDNVDLFRAYPDYPQTPIHLTGNPRGDLLRPELHPYFADEARQYRDEFGEFVLINTNFAPVNAFVAELNLFKPGPNGCGEREFGRGATGMSRQFAEGLHRHKQITFEHIKDLIPKIAESFAGKTIVVRPHPIENPDVYTEIARPFDNVRVVNSGNVIPWLLAAKALVHNGCTTGVEAYMLRVPSLAYQATVDPDFDNDLPNALSYQCYDFPSLRQRLEAVFAGEIGAVNGDGRQQLLDKFMSAREGPLASERIISVLESMTDGTSGLPRPALSDRLVGWYVAQRRRVRILYRSRFPESKYNPTYQRHRFPNLSLSDIQQRVSRFQGLLNDNSTLSVKRLTPRIFRIAAA